MDFKKPSHIKNQQGFTLLEVLIALTLLAMMMVFVYQMISSSTETKDRITEDDRDLMALEFALYRIELDISQIYSPLFHSGLKAIDSSLYEEENQTLDRQDSQLEGAYQATQKFPAMTARGQLVPALENEDKSTFVFFTASNRRKVQNSKQSRYAWIRYRLDSDEKTEDDKLKEELTGATRGEYRIVRQIVTENIYSPEHEWSKVREQVLLRSVKRLEFQYWSEENEKFVSSIRELNAKANSLRMIKLLMTYINNSGNEVEIERIFRVSWPYFDPQKDIDAIKASKKSLDNQDPNNDNGGNNAN
jgi:prepilin-type N-terminal cleavage/methylation domain-containing protein